MPPINGSNAGDNHNTPGVLVNGPSYLSVPTLLTGNVRNNTNNNKWIQQNEVGHWQGYITMINQKTHI